MFSMTEQGRGPAAKQRPKDIVGLAEFCESQGMDPRRAFDVMRTLADKQVLHCAVAEAKLGRASQVMERTARPLEDDGHEWGRIEARIPQAVWFQLQQQENFGFEGLMSDEGMRDILKRWPQCRVKAVSGKVTGVGFGAGPRTVVKNYG
jgi:hypothetical protein